MGAYYVGLDVHSRDTVFVIQDAAGAIIGRGTVPTAPEAFARVCADRAGSLGRGAVCGMLAVGNI